MNKFMYELTKEIVLIFLGIVGYFNEINTKWYDKYKQELNNEIVTLKELLNKGR